MPRASDRVGRVVVDTAGIRMIALGVPICRNPLQRRQRGKGTGVKPGHHARSRSCEADALLGHSMAAGKTGWDTLASMYTILSISSSSRPRGKFPRVLGASSIEASLCPLANHLYLLFSATNTLYGQRQAYVLPVLTGSFINQKSKTCHRGMYVENLLCTF